MTPNSNPPPAIFFKMVGLLEIYTSNGEQDKLVSKHKVESGVLSIKLNCLYRYYAKQGILEMSISPSDLEFLLKPIKIPREGTEIFAFIPTQNEAVVFYGVKNIESMKVENDNYVIRIEHS